jgi:chemotaxis protein MotB
MTPRRIQHEEHINHEAWAIPYGDLVTLLLAFFVVMYSISSVNEDKYRAVASSISSAFNSAGKVIEPIRVGRDPSASTQPAALDVPQPTSADTPIPPPITAPTPAVPAPAGSDAEDRLAGIADRVEEAMAPLIDHQLVVVRRRRMQLEVEIRADILFSSGVANLSPQALPPLKQLATILAGFLNPLHIEGHTDNVPIATAMYPSNWELSAARAASVARLFIDSGVDPHRLAITGLGEYQPEASNATEDGRNKNRRVKLIVMGGGDSDAVPPGAATDAIAQNALAPGANALSLPSTR